MTRLNVGNIRHPDASADSISLDSSARVGIGTSSPGQKMQLEASGSNVYLRVTETGNTGIDFGQATDGNGVINLRDSAAIQILTSNTERLRIDSSGRLLHGTSASVTGNSETRNVQIVTNTNNANQGLGIYAFTSGNNAPRLDLGSSPNGTINSFTTASSSGDLCGRINFLGSDGDEFLPTARIEARVDGTAGNGDMPGRLVFSTTADGASAPTERMRIDSSGNVGIGTTSPAVNGLHIRNSSETVLRLDHSTTNTWDISNDSNLKFSRGGTERMRIDSSGRVGIGTSSPASPLNVRGADTVEGDAHGTLILEDTAAYNANPIAGVIFRGEHASNGSKAYFSSVYGGKQNSTDSDYSGYLAFATRASGSTAAERMRISNTGNVGIGVTSPGQLLHLSSASPKIQLTDTTTGADHLLDGDSGVGTFWVKVDENAEGSNPAFIVDVAGNEKIRVLTGGGITFNGDTAAANALDDYEEGTFTPTISQGVTSPTYTNTGGSYTKIGDCVFFTIRMQCTGGTEVGQRVHISGLPFSSSGSKDEGGASWNYSDNIGNGITVEMHIAHNQTRIEFYHSNGGNWNGNSGNGVINEVMHIHGQYFV